MTGCLPTDFLSARIRFSNNSPSGFNIPIDTFQVKFSCSAGELTLKCRQNGTDWIVLNQVLSGWVSGISVNDFRIEIGAANGYLSGIMCANPGRADYSFLEGTSLAAPVVTGVVALMLQKYSQNVLAPLGQDIHTNPFWNSTAKAILIHSATDMIQLSYDYGEQNNFDFIQGDTKDESYKPTIYSEGPDWATGYGEVNAEKALAFVDTKRFKESTITNGQIQTYYFNVPSGTTKVRTTLAWDDPGANYAILKKYDRTLVNDLDLYLVSPSGTIQRPWVLDYTPLLDPAHVAANTVPSNGIDANVTYENVRDNPATKGIDNKNNVEVVDVTNPVAGRWKLVVQGTSIIKDQNRKTPSVIDQDYSIVCDSPILKGDITPIINLLLGD